MIRNPFDPTIDLLPRRIPIFPLSGVVLFPRSRLPLNIFESRYLTMFVDAFACGRMIGMIQPVDPDCPETIPAVYGTGCAGRIVSFSETEDGRFLVALNGVCRFRVERELEPVSGYRLIEPTWTEFAEDLEPSAQTNIDRCRLTSGLKCFFKLHDMSANWSHIECTPDERLINSLAMICPFTAGEKQALLEAPDLAHRANLLIALIEMAILDCDDQCAAHRH